MKESYQNLVQKLGNKILDMGNSASISKEAAVDADQISLSENISNGAAFANVVKGRKSCD